jgi:hypothetical protein
MSDRSTVPPEQRRKLQQAIVTDEGVHNALEFLRKNAAKIGAARRRLVLADGMVSHVEALQSRMSEEKAADARKAEARASAEYKAAVVEQAEAAGAYETMRAAQIAASAIIECWRSEQANIRSMTL